MPEEFEVPETPETPNSRKERSVGLTIAAIAVVLAIVTHLGNELHQEEVLAHVDATDKFSFYQAKKNRSVELDLNTNYIQLFDDLLTPEKKAKADEKLAEYDTERKKLTEDMKKIMEQADDLTADGKRLAARARVLDVGEILLQISVVICSITVLTEQFIFVRMGVGAATVGVLIAFWVFLLMA